MNWCCNVANSFAAEVLAVHTSVLIFTAVTFCTGGLVGYIIIAYAEEKERKQSDKAVDLCYCLC